MSYEIKKGSKFKKDYKKVIKNKVLKKELWDVLSILKEGGKLDKHYKDHELKGNYLGFRECHIRPDVLLIYKIDENVLELYLLRIGCHSELF